jgi:hypothetical protein
MLTQQTQHRLRPPLHPPDRAGRPASDQEQLAPFHSLLFETVKDEPAVLPAEPPPYFLDLHLDQAIGRITERKQRYQLEPFFFYGPRPVREILYRQAIAQDIERDDVASAVADFAMRMIRTHEALDESAKQTHVTRKALWFLEAATRYRDAVAQLSASLSALPLRSAGLQSFRAALGAYAASRVFTTLSGDVDALSARVGELRYDLIIRDNSVTVRARESDDDFSVRVQEVFKKFRTDAKKEYLAAFSDTLDMGHVEEKILDFVVNLFPEPFDALQVFCEAHRNLPADLVTRFEREVQFYVNYLSALQTLAGCGIQRCYPVIATEDKAIAVRDGGDLALGFKVHSEGGHVTTNDFSLSGEERVIVVSGPNQGGKTTFARMFGQMHYLAALGLPVPARKARLFLFDRMFSHFERQEDIRTLRGKLEDDLVRIHEILVQATDRSVIVINEIFTSTAYEDAVDLGRKIIADVIDHDALCVCVTFLDELSRLGPELVSMVSETDPSDPAIRTFKVSRRPADGLAYALSIAEKYRVTHKHLTGRLRA